MHVNEPARPPQLPHDGRALQKDQQTKVAIAEVARGLTTPTGIEGLSIGAPAEGAASREAQAISVIREHAYRPSARTKSVLLAGLVLAAGLASAQPTPVGLWRNVDDKTGEVKAEIRIAETTNGLAGRIEKILRKNAKSDDKCDECTDERKGKPIVGLEIIRGAKKAEGKDVWEDGKILDPESGREYRLRLTPIEGGKRLEVRGSIGPFGRTQTWLRAE